MNYGILEEYFLKFVPILIRIMLDLEMIRKAQVMHVTSLVIVLCLGIARSKLWLHCLLLRPNTFQLVLNVLKYCGCNIHLRTMGKHQDDLIVL